MKLAVLTLALLWATACIVHAGIYNYDHDDNHHHRQHHHHHHPHDRQHQDDNDSGASHVDTINAKFQQWLKEASKVLSGDYSLEYVASNPTTMAFWSGAWDKFSDTSAADDAAAITEQDRDAFDAYCQRYDYIFESEYEYLVRLSIWKQSMAIARQMQAEDQATGLYGESRWSIYTEQEFLDRLETYTDAEVGVGAGDGIPTCKELPAAALNSLPTTWDASRIFPAAKNQGSCSSCWAFAAVASAEAAAWMHESNLLKTTVTPLSEEELVDCLTPLCQPYYVGKGLNYIKLGIASAADYPYCPHNGTVPTADCKQPLKCRQNAFPRTKPVAASCKFNSTLTNAEAQMQGYLPVGVVPFVMRGKFLKYVTKHTGGYIYHPTPAQCGTTSTYNHAMTIVGYGHGYWLVRNSWGANWGDSGYFRVSRGTGTCGIGNYAFVSFPKHPGAQDTDPYQHRQWY